MTYTVLAVAATLTSVLLDLFVVRTQVVRTLAFWLSYLIILAFQLVVNGVLTGYHIVTYSPAAITGLRLAHAPVEDIGFGFAMTVTCLMVWLRLRPAPHPNGRREEELRVAAPLQPGLRRSVAATVCWCTAITYSSFAFAAAAGSRLPASRSYVSELEAAGQPFRGAFRLSDVVSGIGLLLVAIMIGRLVPPRRASRAGRALLGLAAVASLFDAANPMVCAPSINAACRARQDSASGLIRQVAQPHTTSSLIGFVATGLALLLFGTSFAATSPGFARLSVGCAVLTGLSGLADLVLILAHSVIGISERARIVVFSLWLLALGIRLLRAPPVVVARAQHLVLSRARSHAGDAAPTQKELT